LFNKHGSWLACRWVCVRIDSLGALFTAGLAAYLVYGDKVTPKAHNTGFSLNMAVGFSSMILWWVRLLNEFEVSGARCLNGIAGENLIDVGKQATGKFSQTNILSHI
jgi:hypothetical protein